MSVKHALLSLLEQEPMYGYQLRQEFEARTGGTWPLNVGQVYTTLTRLERDGLVTREVHAEVPPRVEYTLTPLGGTLVQAVAGLDAWARAHIDEVERSRAAYDARG